MQDLSKFTSLQIESPRGSTQNGQGSLCVARMTAVQRDGIVNNPIYPSVDGKALKILEGTIVYNTTTDSIDVFEAGKWVEFNTGAGDVVGPNNSIDGHIAVFDGVTGKVIKSSGVPIAPVLKNEGVNINSNNTPLYQISNLGALQFGSNTNIADTGVILVDSLTPLTFQTQGTGANAQVCSVFNGELGEGSSSHSAIVELNTTTGALLLSRLSEQDRSNLVTPVGGMIAFDKDNSNLVLYDGATWKTVGGGSGGGNVIGESATDGKHTLAVWDGNSSSTLANTKITIDPETNDISIPGTVAGIAFGLDSADGKDYAIGLVAPNLTSSYNLIYPSAPPDINQIMAAKTINNEDITLDWVDNGKSGGGISGPANSTQYALSMWGDTKGESLSDTKILLDDIGSVKSLNPAFHHKDDDGSLWYNMDINTIDNTVHPFADNNLISTTSFNAVHPSLPNSIMYISSYKGSSAEDISDTNLRGQLVLTSDPSIGFIGSKAGGAVHLGIPGNISQNLTLTLPGELPTVDGQVLASTRGGIMSWVDSGGGISGPSTSTKNALAVWGDTMGSSLLSTPYALPATLPTTNGQVLSSDTSGKMSWVNGVKAPLVLNIDSGNATPLTVTQTAVSGGAIAIYAASCNAGTGTGTIYAENKCIGHTMYSLCGSSGAAALSANNNGSGYAITGDSNGQFQETAKFTNTGGGKALTANASSKTNVAIDTIGVIYMNGSAVPSSLKMKEILSENQFVHTEAADLFGKIPFFKYKHKDNAHGGKPLYGMVAEHLAEVMPEAVDQTAKTIIPNLLTRCQTRQKRVPDKNKDRYVYELSFTEESRNALKAITGDILTLSFEKDGQKFGDHAKITQKDGLKLIVETRLELPSAVFAYGTKETCPYVDKTMTFELGLVVLQALLKRVEALEKTIH